MAHTPRADGWDSLSNGQLASILTPYWPQAELLQRRAQAFASQRPAIRTLMVRHCLALGLDLSDPFHPHPPPERLGQGEIRLGIAEPSGREFRASALEFNHGAGFFGDPGSGKSTAAGAVIEQYAALGYGAVVVERRGDLLGLAQRLSNALVIPIRRDRFNLLAPPHRLRVDQWLPVVASLLTVFFLMQAPGKMFASRLLAKTWKTALDRGLMPTINDFLELLSREKQPRGSSQEMMQLRIRDRADAVRQACGDEVVSVQQGFPLVEMAEQGRPVFIDARGVDSTIADFWCAARIIFPLYYSRMSCTDPFRQRKILIVCDEARSLIRARESGELPPFEELVTKLRGLNLGMLTCEQVPSSISRAVMASLRLRFGFRCAPPESRALAELLGLTREQAKELPHLPTGTAIARIGGDRISVPFRVRVQPGSGMAGDLDGDTMASVDTLIERSLRELEPHVASCVSITEMRASLKQVLEVQRTPRSKNASLTPPPNPLTGLTEVARMVLTRMASFFEETIAERCAVLGIDRNQEWRVRRELDQHGLIQEAGRLGKLVFFGLTEKGWECLERKGPKFKSGLAHEAVRRRLKRAIGTAIEGARFQSSGQFGGVQPDLTVKLPEGFRVAVQICHANSVEYEVDRLRQLARQPTLDRILMVAVDKKKAREMGEELQVQRGPAEAAPRDREDRTSAWGDRGSRKDGKIVVLDAETALSERIDWRSILLGQEPAGSKAER